MARIMKKPIIYGVAGLGTVIIGYFIYDLLKSKSDAKKYTADLTTPSNSSTKVPLTTGDISSNAAQPSNDAYPLKVGSYGAKVFVLQEALNKLGASLNPDGKFGNMTYDAIKALPFGFGTLNIMCFDYGCMVDYGNWDAIIKKAEAKGFDTSSSWTRAKKLWTV
jgi:hypothetical protein